MAASSGRWRIHPLNKFRKSLGEIKSDYKNPLVLVDTGALIDIERMVRNHNLTEKDSLSIGKILDEYNGEDGLKFLITPEVQDEIESHAWMRINGNEMELSREAIGLASEYAFRFNEMYENQLNLNDYGETQVRNWLEIANLREKLDSIKSDGISRSDLEILRKATDFCKIPDLNGDLPSRVFIMSSDGHLGTGVAALRERGFDSLNYASTRYYGTR